MSITSDNCKVEKLFDETLDQIQGGSAGVATVVGAVAMSVAANALYDVGKNTCKAVYKKIVKIIKKDRSSTREHTQVLGAEGTW